MNVVIHTVIASLLLGGLLLTGCVDCSGNGGLEAVTIKAIPGVTPPVAGETPVTTITATEQYTGTVVWDPEDDTFREDTEYRATITLSAKQGYTFTGVPANFFTVAEATRVINDADSRFVNAWFPATGSP